MQYTFLTMGFDCSPASALKSLGLRKFSSPFDWVQTDIHSIERCFADGFKGFHTNLSLNHDKTRLIDEYGIQYPHEYPVVSSPKETDVIGEDVWFSENRTDHIADDWMTRHPEVKEKYNRRIERFKNIMNNPNPIIVLSRYSTTDVIKLQHLFLTNFVKKNIYFVNSSAEVFSNDQIANIWTEENGLWNDINLWEKGIYKMMDRIKI